MRGTCSSNAYWLADDYHPSYGYGVDRRPFIAQPVLLMIILLVGISLILTGMERAALGISMLGAVVVGLLVFLDARSPYHGWYEVDADGKPPPLRVTRSAVRSGQPAGGAPEDLSPEGAQRPMNRWLYAALLALCLVTLALQAIGFPGYRSALETASPGTNPSYQSPDRSPP